MNSAILLHENLKEHLHEKGFKQLTPIQEASIPAILQKNNVLLIAGTSGGKTEAALLPVLTILATDDKSSIKAIYIAPLKALLNNLEARIQEYAGCVYKSVFKWHGDVSASKKKNALKDPPDILVITPESLEVMFISSLIDKAIFKDIRFIIVDEVHNFAESDRGVHLLSLMEKIQLFSEHPIQRIGMSATIANPVAVLDWFSGSSPLSRKVIQPTITPKEKEWRVFYREEFAEAVPMIEKSVINKKSIIFVKSKGFAEKASRKFEHIEPFVHHASIDKDWREHIEEQMMTSKNCVISTSTLELGIDIGDLDLIIQYNLPPSVSSLLQRIGRTGRRPGQISIAHCYCEEPVQLLLVLAMINCAAKGKLSPLQLRTDNYHIFFHQVLCGILQKHGLIKKDILQIKNGNTAFKSITDIEIEELISFWLEHDYLRFDGKVFLIGGEADKRLSYRNYAELYAVFSASDEYDVYCNRARVGSLDPAFVVGLSVPFNFTLAGKDWTAIEIDHDYRTVLVESTSLSKEPHWGLRVGEVITQEVAEECRYILIGGSLEPSIILEDAAVKELAHLQKDIATESWSNNSHAYLVTFAGTKINHTLRLTLEALINNIDIEESFYQLELHQKGTSGNELLKQIYEVIGKIALMTEDEYKDFILPLVDEYEYSKFTRFLPECFNRRFILGEICDINGSLEWLASELL
jgi:ATP-dependent helicase Lhr and Lhr-like helicase